MSYIGLKYPELLNIRDENGTLVTGGSQYWYPSEGFIPNGACGATAASNILGYLLMTRGSLYASACDTGLIDPAMPKGFTAKEQVPVQKTEYLEFMKKIYEFLYPHPGGLMADGFAEGISKFASKYKLPLDTKCLKIPINRKQRPLLEEVIAFIKTSLEADIPVAFLILSSGCVSVLDTWHWVTILGLDEGKGSAQIVDNGKVFTAVLGPWLDTSIMGGAFVRFSV